MAKKGHHFPSGVFSHSSGKKQSVRGYTRAVPIKKAQGGAVQRPVGMSGPKMIPQAPVKSPVMPHSSPKTPPMQIRQAPIMRNTQPVRGRGALAFAEGGYVKQGDATMKTESIGDQGNAAVKRGKPPYSEADKEYGGTSPLRTGYKKGGVIVPPARVKAEGPMSDKDAALYAKAAAPKKGAPTFNKAPLFGKK